MTGKHDCFGFTRVRLGRIITTVLTGFVLFGYGAWLIRPAAGQSTVQKAAPVPGKAGKTPVEKGDKTKPNAKKRKPLPPTEINSDSLEYDFNKQRIVFAGNVNVVDNQLELKADKMTVHLDKKTQTVNRIVAAGSVKLKTADGKATGEKADYDLKQGKVILSGEPIIHTNGGLMKGALKVVYDRTNGKFRTEGGSPRLEIRNSDATGAVNKFIKKSDGDDKKDKKDGKKPVDPKTGKTPSADAKKDAAEPSASGTEK